MGKWILTAADGADPAQMGGKAASLARLAQAGVIIPPWFVITPQAFADCLNPAQRQTLASMDVQAMRATVAGVQPSAELIEQITAALRRIAPQGEPVAVRSSGVDEDGKGHSFAGQFESFLFVSHADVARRIVDVWLSGFAPRVATYRQERGLATSLQPPAVLVQRMIEPEVSGVAFGADPVSGRRGVAVLSAVFGLGSALVSGEANADTYHIDRNGRVTQKQIASKTHCHRAQPGGGTQTVALSPEQAAAPTLSDAQAIQVAALVRKVGLHFGRPQDIEWALQGQELFLLQSRPITTLTSQGDPDGVRRLWDNSNIAESYSGVTTPLTFSFARRAYEEVYRQFCRMLAVPARRIDEESDLFRNMLGLVRGRVYYNLVNWYRLLSLLPGYTINRGFMEQMMGVREALPESLLPKREAPTLKAKVIDAVQMSASALGLLLNQCVIEKRIKAFNERFERAMRVPSPPLGEMRLDELAAEYRSLERQLLTRWDAPLVNDFLAMIAFGLLRSLCGKWLEDRGSLHNDLLSGEGGIISTEPPRRVQEMARMIAADERVTTALCDLPAEQALAEARQRPDFAERLRQYLDQFGDRCVQELKLESPTLEDDPTPLLRAIGHAARRMAAGDSSGTAGDRSLRADAQKIVDEALGERRVKHKVFNWVLRQARQRVRQRENLRFQRTRLFGRVRRIMVEFGRRLHAEGLLDEPRDVFYLEVEEVLGLVEGTATLHNPAGLARLRKQEFEAYQQADAPPDRFETFGAVAVGQPVATTAAPAALASGQAVKGVGACPGIVMGPVRVVLDPRHADVQRGQILVARQTDPGWVMLLASASGLLVERGSLLSHSAIVAREMGIPAVVGVPNLVSLVQDGQWVQLDGSTGEVRLIDAPVTQPPAPPPTNVPTVSPDTGKLTIHVE